ncbi:ABC transporter substrate-binding protein [Citricoccus sp. K5]|uniref:ABC transporter substrate-binding protein n=1 Tax=Citricoccus sp. K5 TaxID=2653135 RepID=UPI0012F3C3A2|nr:ABC transporter substrate-binding protein [Citricoccus sp. K5]VXB84697.1 Thiamine biosynthesis protein [Citricoccus sp. K5]
MAMTRRITRTALTTMTTLAAAGLLLTGCSGGSPSGTDSSAPAENAAAGTEELTPVTVGLLPIATSAAVPLGIDEGIFEKHGLDVTIQQGQGGAALLPAVSSGTVEFAVGNPQSILLANSQGLDIKIIAGYSTSYENVDDPEDQAPSGVIALEESGISSWADLEGKRVAVNTLNTQGHLTIMQSVEADGGDPEQVEFTEIGFPDQLAQLEQGNIDAAWIPEPFLSQGRAQEGIQFIGDSLRAIDGLYSMVTFTNGDYAEANPEVVAAFRDATTESTELAMADEDAFREAIVDYTGMDAAVVDSLNLEYLSGELDRTILEDLSATAHKFGFLDSEPDLDQTILD